MKCRIPSCDNDAHMRKDIHRWFRCYECLSKDFYRLFNTCGYSTHVELDQWDWDSLQTREEYYLNYLFFYELAVQQYNNKYEKKQNLENLELIKDKLCSDLYKLVSEYF